MNEANKNKNIFENQSQPQGWVNNQQSQPQQSQYKFGENNFFEKPAQQSTNVFNPNTMKFGGDNQTKTFGSFSENKGSIFSQSQQAEQKPNPFGQSQQSSLPQQSQQSSLPQQQQQSSFPQQQQQSSFPQQQQQSSFPKQQQSSFPQQQSSFTQPQQSSPFNQQSQQQGWPSQGQNSFMNQGFSSGQGNAFGSQQQQFGSSGSMFGQGGQGGSISPPPSNINPAMMKPRK